MANFYESSRSSYFRVKDEKTFRKFISRFSGAELIEHEEKKGLFGFLAPEGVSYVVMVDGEPDEQEDADFVGMLAEHLADGEVMVVLSIGWEKMRYLIGTAVAINNKKEEKIISLDDIYDLAKQLTDKPDLITRAEY